MIWEKWVGGCVVVPAEERASDVRIAFFDLLRLNYILKKKRTEARGGKSPGWG